MASLGTMCQPRRAGGGTAAAVAAATAATVPPLRRTCVHHITRVPPSHANVAVCSIEQRRGGRGLQQQKQQKQQLRSQRHQASFTGPFPGDPVTAIIGGGLSGLACAQALARRGLRSVVFDTGEHGVCVPQFLTILMLAQPLPPSPPYPPLAHHLAPPASSPQRRAAGHSGRKRRQPGGCSPRLRPPV